MYGSITALLETLETHRLIDLNVISWGCPVPFFGHLESAQLATVGINPSNREFVGVDGNELLDPFRRLPTLQSLGLSSWSQADFVALRSILTACCGYFEKNPYDRWFGSLQRIIEPTGRSYYAPRSDACHLDVVPWATSNKWGTLSATARKQLVERAARALIEMIAASPLKMLILNGQEVVRQFETLLGRQLYRYQVSDWDLPRRSGRAVPGQGYYERISSLAGISLGSRAVVIGYDHNLQSSFGVTATVRDSISQ